MGKRDREKRETHRSDTGLQQGLVPPRRGSKNRQLEHGLLRSAPNEPWAVPYRRADTPGLFTGMETDAYLWVDSLHHPLHKEDCHPERAVTMKHAAERRGEQEFLYSIPPRTMGACGISGAVCNVRCTILPKRSICNNGPTRNGTDRNTNYRSHVNSVGAFIGMNAL